MPDTDGAALVPGMVNNACPRQNDFIRMATESPRSFGRGMMRSFSINDDIR